MKKGLSFFQKDYYRATNYLNTHPSDIDFLQRFTTQLLPKYIKKIRDENPNATIDELKKAIEIDTVKFAETAFKSVHVFPTYMQYVSCEYLINHPKKFDSLYEKVKSQEKSDNITYYYNPSNNFDDYLILYLRELNASSEDIIGTTKKFLSCNSDFFTILDDKDSNLSEKDKLNKVRKHCGKLRYSNLDTETICRMARYYLYGIKAFLPEDKKNMEKFLKKTLSDSIISLYEKFDRLDLFSKYNNILYNQCLTMNFVDFANSSKPSVLSNEQLLQRLSVDDLMTLNSFWMNKYTKELKTFYQSIFLMNNTNSLESILNEIESTNTINSENPYKKLYKLNLNIPEEKYKSTLLKWYILRIPAEKYIDEQQEKFNNGELDKDSYESDDSKTFITYSFMPLAERVSKRYNDEYEKMFHLLYNEENINLENDILQVARFSSPIVNLYDMKDVSLEALLANLENNNDIVNYGLIVDSNEISISADKTHVIFNSNFAGIGIDANLTSPIREHIRLHVLTEFLKSVNGNAIIPIYEGYNDFKENGDIQSIQIVTPFSDEQKKLVKNTIMQDDPKKSKKSPQNKTKIINDRNRNYIQHLNFLRDSSCIPDSFKTDTLDSKGRNKKVFIKRYVDLETGQIYTKENNNYIPVAPEQHDKTGFSINLEDVKNISVAPERPVKTEYSIELGDDEK